LGDEGERRPEVECAHGGYAEPRRSSRTCRPALGEFAAVAEALQLARAEIKP
jgi:hypothetical protein